MIHSPMFLKKKKKSNHPHNSTIYIFFKFFIS